MFELSKGLDVYQERKVFYKYQEKLKGWRQRKPSFWTTSLTLGCDEGAFVRFYSFFF